ncbi:MAG: methyltransferase domain-containing protein [Chloroflexi bacterium]|nr:methyltransferase domain-containing protein [Chloroflexota bacterium]
MTEVAQRYDSAAADYGRYWAPVLADASLRLLNLVKGPAPTVVLDVGTGAGALIFAALRRWPYAEVIGTDASAGMLDVARRGAAALPAEESRRLRLLHGAADRVPVEPTSVDLVVSSFVYQLVPDRPAAFREALRVLRPRGRLAFVTWIDRDSQPFPAGDEFDEAVLDLAIEEPDYPPEEVAGDYASAGAAASQLRRAGFRDVSARELWLEYRWTLESYLDYKVNYGERALFRSLGEATADRLWRRARERLEVLPPDAFCWRTPVVYAFGSRPG